MTATIQDRLGELETLRLRRQESFILLARRAADGEDVSAQEIDDVLRGAEKTPQEFSSLVAKFVRRTELRANIAQVEENVARIETLRAEIEKHNATLELAVEEHRRATRPIQNEISVAEAFVLSHSGDKTAMQNECPSEELQSRSRALQRRRQEAYTAWKNATDELHRAEQHTPRDEADASRRKMFMERASAAIRAADDLQAELEIEGKELQTAMLEY